MGRVVRCVFRWGWLRLRRECFLSRCFARGIYERRRRECCRKWRQEIMKRTERIVSYQKPSTGYWVIPTEKGDFHLAQGLIPVMTQRELASFTSPEEFRATSMKGYMNVLSAEQSLVLTGRKPEEVAEIIRYINETPSFVWRLNSKPRSVDERVAWFVADSDGAYFDCYWDDSLRDASLGVRVV